MITAAYTPDVYTGNGSTTVFAYNFKIVDQAHIKVEEVVIATGVRTTLEIGTHYSVSGVGEDAGGNITMVTAPASTKKLVLSLSIAVRQNTNFENQGEYFAEDHEDALDLLTLMVQQAREELDRTPKVTIESGETGDDLIASIEADVAAAAASASAAAASATAAAASATTASTAATNAGTSATAAATSATNAATSATNAANSATAAASSATDAETAQTAAEAAQAAAATSATNAASSASAASTSATNASTSATNAASSATTASTAATNAGNSATAAAASASAASTSATNAATSETNAAASATLASDWAQKTSSTVAGAGTYSAKEWAVGTQTRGVAGAGSAKDWATYTGGTVDGTGYSAKYWAEQAAAGTTDATIPTSDVTTNNVSSTKHGWAPKSPGDATKFLNGAATPDYAAVKDSDLALTDITTNDVSTSKHGFVPKAPNDTTKFLRGDGTWAVLAGSGWVDNGTTINTDNNANNFVIGSTSAVAGTSGAGVLVIAEGTAPSTSPSDLVQLYAAAGEAAISGGTGTNIGNMTAGGGLAAAFDGTTAQTGNSGAKVDGVSTAYCGKDWGVGVTKSIVRVIAYSSNDNAWSSLTNGGTGTFTLQGSTDNFSSSVVDLGSTTGSMGTTAQETVNFVPSDLTAYRYHRLKITSSNGTENFCLAELVFYEPGTAELKVRDEGGNITTLSPHNFKDIPVKKAAQIKTESDGLGWTFHSEKDGKSITVDMFSAIRELEKLSGKKLIYTSGAFMPDAPDTEKDVVKKLRDKIVALEAQVDALKAQ